MLRHSLQQLWRTPSTLYALILAWVLLYGFTFFWGQFLLSNQASFDTFFSFHPWVYLFLAPALTLFGWPEEVKNGTLKRYVNMPVSAARLVVSHYAARLTALVVFLLGTLPFAGVVWWLGSPEWTLYVSGLVGSFMVGAVLLALATLMSLGTVRPLVALVRGMLTGAVLLYLVPALNTPLPVPLSGFSWSLMSSYQHITLGYVTLVDAALLGLLIIGFLGLADVLLARQIRKTAPASGLLGLMALVGLFVIQFLPPYVLDVTPSQRHTLHPASVAFVENISTPTQLTLYTPASSQKLPPFWRNHALRTEQLLGQLAAENDAVTLEVIHPELSPAAEYAARNAGLVPLTMAGAQPLFHGLVITSDVGDATLPQLAPNRAHLLEFDVMGGLLKASRAVPPQIGLLTEMNLDPTTSTKRPRFLEALINSYGVKKVSAYDPEIPPEIDLLIVLQTPTMSIESVYALDQYLVNGGKAIVLLDPFFRTAPSADLRAADRNADAKDIDHPADILRRLGVEYDYRLLVADNSIAMPIELENVGRTRYPLWLDVGRNYTTSAHPMLTNINRLALIESGFFNLIGAPEGVNLTPLVTTSGSGQYVVREDLMTLSPQGIAANLRGTPTTHPLAVEITGHVQSIWPELPAAIKQYVDDYALDPSNIVYPEHQTKSDKSATLIALADLDFLSDDYTLATQNGGAPSAENPLANDNLMFMFNMVQTLLDEDVLVPLRSRAPLSQPFHKLEGYLMAAARYFTQIEAAIGERLLANAADRDILLESIGEATPTVAQQEELDALAVREVSLQRELRATQHHLQTLMQRIGYVLMALVFFLPPLLALLGWLCYMWLVQRKRTHSPMYL